MNVTLIPGTAAAVVVVNSLARCRDAGLHPLQELRGRAAYTLPHGVSEVPNSRIQPQRMPLPQRKSASVQEVRADDDVRMMWNNWGQLGLDS